MGLTDILSLAIAAILVNNYILVQFLGCCSFFGVSKKTDTALGMGMAVIFVMAIASAASWAVQYFILEPLGLGYMQTIAFILVIATLVQFVEMFMKKAMPSLYSALGIFLPLIVVNCIILGRAEAYASKNKVLPSALDGVVMGLGLTFALVLMGFFRELLGAGTILSGYVNGVNGIAVPFFNSNPMVMMILPAGGFLMMGFILAAIQKIMARKEDK